MIHLAGIFSVKAVRRLLLAIGGLLLIFLGLDILFHTSLLKDLAGWKLRWTPIAEMDETALLVLGGLCVLLPLTCLLLKQMELRLERGIVGRGAQGRDISLTPEELESVIISEVNAAVTSAQVISCEATQGSRGPRVVLNVAVNYRDPIPAVQRQILQIVSDTLTQKVGYAKPSRIRVRVTHLKRPVRRASDGARKGRVRPARTRPVESASQK
ncbi:hypothetical protein BH09SUM1_BH09SUM1_31700 [soil metagenome]